MTTPRIPTAPKSIQKGTPLKYLLGQEAAEYLAYNISLVHTEFDGESFCKYTLEELEPLGIIERGQKFSKALRQFLPETYEAAIKILLASLTPPLPNTEDNGLEVFFYLPHVSFVAEYGLDSANNQGRDPFEISMNAQYELTKRFSSEFSIRQFLIQEQERTLAQLLKWVSDPNPHVRRLCSEGSRPRLPWAKRIPSFMVNPNPVLPILEILKDDQSLYVRRSVANHLGDIAKDHPDLVFEICERWLAGSSNEIRWLIRHALRHPAKKGDRVALKIRAAAKAKK